MSDIQLGRPNFDGAYGLTTNPLRQIFMMGAIWRLSQISAIDKVQILEIGSWVGASALTWGESVQEYFEGNGKITCVDAWEPYVDLEVNPDDNIRRMDDVLQRNEPFDVFSQNILFVPESVEVEVRRGWSKDILPSLQAESYCLIYIDGDHTFAGVLSDIINSVGLVRDGGIICGDDLELQADQCDLSILNTKPNIDQCYDEELDKYYHPGVTKAVGEYFGTVSAWFGFWAVQKSGDGWSNVSLHGMPARIPKHISSKSLMGLKALLMVNNLL